MKIEDIARACHAVNRAYCNSLGDLSQKPWDEAPAEHRASAIRGVTFLLNTPSATPEDSHKSWLATHTRLGWTFGAIKDEAEKRHPCMVAYECLPDSQKAKDHLFMGTVRALAEHLS